MQKLLDEVKDGIVREELDRREPQRASEVLEARARRRAITRSRRSAGDAAHDAVPRREGSAAGAARRAGVGCGRAAKTA